jgi:hypothetical protein
MKTCNQGRGGSKCLSGWADEDSRPSIFPRHDLGESENPREEDEFEDDWETIARKKKPAAEYQLSWKFLPSNLRKSFYSSIVIVLWCLTRLDYILIFRLKTTIPYR